MGDDLPKLSDPAAMWNRVRGVDALVASLRGLRMAAEVGIETGRKGRRKNFHPIERVLRNRRVLVS